MLEFLLNNDFLAALIAFALVLIPAIIIHELGHFFAAKSIGINVLEFGIGFPPRMVRLFTWGETEITLNWLPIGGFVRPLGEDFMGPSDEEMAQRDRDADDDVYYDDYQQDDEKPKNATSGMYMSDRDELRARGIRDEEMMSVNDAKPLSRIFFMFAGPLANFISAVIFFIIVALFGLPTDMGARMQVVHLPDNSMFSGTALGIGDGIEKINDTYFTDTQDYLRQIRDLSGQDVQITVRDFEENEVFDVTVTPDVGAVQGYVFVGTVVEDSPAHEAGLQAGDLIIGANGQPIDADGVEPAQVIVRLTDEFAGRLMTLDVLREDESGAEILQVNVTPRLDPPPGQGKIGVGIESVYVTDDSVRYIAAGAVQELIPQSFGDSVQYGFTRLFDTFELFVSVPVQLIQGTLSPEEARPVSIVGISNIGGQFIQQSIRDGNPVLILNFVAVISIALGVTNLLPIPALDGGRILFVLIEIVRGKPLPLRTEAIINTISFYLLLALGLLIILYDIFNPIDVF